MNKLIFLLFLIKFIFCQELCPVSETLPNRVGFLQSPNFPENYPSSLDCRWVNFIFILSEKKEQKKFKIIQLRN